MAFRFRRSLRIAPGLRLNVGKKGVSLSAGPRGASISAGTRGVHSNVGIPGTGMSMRQRLDKPARKARAGAAGSLTEDTQVKVSLSLDEKGKLIATNEFGETPPAAHMRLVWEQQGPQLHAWLMEKAEEINGDVGVLENIYLNTPNPDTKPSYEKRKFDEPPPKSPKKPPIPERPVLAAAKKPPLSARLFEKKREAFEHAELVRKETFEEETRAWKKAVQAINDGHDKAVAVWKVERAEWLERFNAFKGAEEQRAVSFETLVMKDLDTMQDVLDQNLTNIEWPRETLVDYEITDDNKSVWIDVDLPEIEDLPQQMAALAASGKRLNIKNKPQTILRGEYASHIHGIVFLLAGTSFASLPGIEEVVISGYSQRLDKATGKIDDDYLLSVRFGRNGFSTIDFDSLENVDPINAIELFEHRRKMTKTGIFRAIEPFQSP